MKDAPGEDRDTTGIGRAIGRTRGNLLWQGGSVSCPSPAERKGVSPHPTRQVHTAYTVVTGRFSVSASILTATQPGECARRVVPSKRPATLRCARSGVPGPSAAGRAPATNGSRTRGGAVAVRFALEAECCGRLGCRRSDALLQLHVGGDKRVLCARCARRWSA